MWRAGVALSNSRMFGWTEARTPDGANSFRCSLDGIPPSLSHCSPNVYISTSRIKIMM